MENGDKPAFSVTLKDNGNALHKEAMGLTKREYACIKLGIPETGDKELDDLIKKSERKRIAGLAMQAMVSRGDKSDGWSEQEAKQCIYIADELLKQLK